MAFFDFLADPMFSQYLGSFGRGMIGAGNWNQALAGGFNGLNNQIDQNEWNDTVNGLFAAPQPNQVAVTPQVSDVNDKGAPVDSNPQIAQQRAAALATNAQDTTAPGALYGSELQPLAPLIQQLGPKALPLILQNDAFKPKGRMLSTQEAISMNLPNADTQPYALGTDGIPKPIGTVDRSAPTIHEVKVGNSYQTMQWDPQTNSWSIIAKAPRYKAATATNPNAAPVADVPPIGPNAQWRQ